MWALLLFLTAKGSVSLRRSPRCALFDLPGALLSLGAPISNVLFAKGSAAWPYYEQPQSATSSFMGGCRIFVLPSSDMHRILMQCSQLSTRAEKFCSASVKPMNCSFVYMTLEEESLKAGTHPKWFPRIWTEFNFSLARLLAVVRHFHTKLGCLMYVVCKWIVDECFGT